MIINVARHFMGMSTIFHMYSLFLEEITCSLAQEINLFAYGKLVQGIARELSWGMMDGLEK